MISSIPTNYKGHTFRSQMEARWAVFFDYFGIVWNYEPHGLSFESEKYLPDFYLPDFNLYVEVKYNKDPDAIRITKKFASHHCIDIVVCDGNPHTRPLLLFSGSDGRAVLGFESKILFFYKKGEGLAYDVSKPSIRPEYLEAVEKANTSRFGSMEIKTMLGQARKECESKLKKKLKVLQESYNIKDAVINDVLRTFMEFNEISNQRAFNAVYRDRVDGLSLEQKPISETFDYNKGLTPMPWRTKGSKK